MALVTTSNLYSLIYSLVGYIVYFIDYIVYTTIRYQVFFSWIITKLEWCCPPPPSLSSSKSTFSQPYFLKRNVLVLKVVRIGV